mmetsp:Transcript_12829/g.27849  ORF Transcript_12829/g.27849 Transcript_12829/m.27849 type:complete len:527 (-) Transcript_12829:317-1897(-)
MFIFTARPMDSNHPFLRMSDEFEGYKTEIMLQSLRRNSVCELVAEILRIGDTSECTSLANFIFCVTDGNPFFVRQQIISLRDEGLLRFGSNGWVWDIDAIEKIQLGKNVVTMLSEKMQKLPLLTQQALKICSCMGSKIDLYILGLLVRETHFVENSYTEDNETTAKTAISMAVQEGLLVVTQNGKGVTFTHDSINEAAYSTIKERAPYHLKLGKALHKNVCPNLLNKYLFTIAAQLARGIELLTDDDDRIAMAHIFLRAGEKSMSASAFSEANFFFAHAISSLHKDDWNNNYRLCCDIYTKAADTAFIQDAGNSMDTYLAILFDHCGRRKKGSLLDFLNASYIQVRSLASREDPSALDVGIEALRLAGVNLPSRNLAMHTIVGLAKTRCAMKGKSADKLLQLPPITDKRMIQTSRLLHLCVLISNSWNQKMLPLLCFRIVQLNLTHGMSKAMPSAMALYGAILSRFGYPQTEAAKYGGIALALTDKLECNDTMANVASTFTAIKKLSDLSGVSCTEMFETNPSTFW